MTELEAGGRALLICCLQQEVQMCYNAPMKRIAVYVLPILLTGLLLGCTPQTPVPEATPAPTPIAAEEQEIITVADEILTPIPVPTPSPSPAPTDTPEPTATPAPTPTPKPLEGLAIGIDPGHQRIYDPKPEPVAPGSSTTKQKVAGGCRGVKSGVYEYEVNLNVGLKLRDLLEEQGATVVMTHDTLDVNISNIERAQLFNERNVDLGIRLHCNKASERKTRGAFMLIPKENRTKFYDFNLRAAETVLKAYLEETGLPMRYKTGITERGDQTGFNWCERPIINIEMGHLSNPDEDLLLSDEAFQSKMAQGLCNGIVAFFAAERGAEQDASNDGNAG